MAHLPSRRSAALPPSKLPLSISRKAFIYVTLSKVALQGHNHLAFVSQCLSNAPRQLSHGEAMKRIALDRIVSDGEACSGQTVYSMRDQPDCALDPWIAVIQGHACRDLHLLKVDRD